MDPSGRWNRRRRHNRQTVQGEVLVRRLVPVIAVRPELDGSESCNWRRRHHGLEGVEVLRRLLGRPIITGKKKMPKFKPSNLIGCKK